ncbi:MAG: glycosyl hydrolase family 98 [Prevotella sp.]|nr:glycosyl hydrolase family 98 [Prevotella sp.]
MKRTVTNILLLVLLMLTTLSATAQERRPIDNQHPLWFIHVDVWYRADPQKIIDLIPEDIRPYVCLNLSLSCSYDTDLNIYKMPQYAFQTYKSWGTVCQQNGMWFTCQPASGGHTHIQDYDLTTFEYFFKQFPNFLGWNYAEQFWGFDAAGDMSSATQTGRWALFANLVEMSHRYGGFLTVSFCGNIWSHGLNPIGELKRNRNFLNACQQYPEAILFLYKYTTSSCFYNNESVTFGPFISGLTRNYGVRYDNCGWNGALDAILGENHGKKYPAAAGIGTVMEQMGVNGAAVWDGPELTWREECFHEGNRTTVNGYTRRTWERFPNMNNVWIDMFREVINGNIYIPSREEVVGKTKIVIINNVSSGNDEQMYATWGDLYDGLYKQQDPFNRGNGQWMDNYCYFKSTGRYGAIPMVTGLYDDLARAIPVQVNKSNYTSRWSTIAKKQADFNAQYPEVSKGNLYVNRYRNQLVTYTPYPYLNAKTGAQARIPLLYNTCDSLLLSYDKLSSGVIREFNDHISLYLNNYRTDTTTLRTDIITIKGAATKPTHTLTRHTGITVTSTEQYDEAQGIYTLTVNHCGAVNVDIACTGHNDRSPVGDGLPVATPLPQPKQPALWRGEILIEAEDMDYKNVNACVTDGYGQNGGSYRSVLGYAGNGFVDMGTNSTGALRHQLTLKEGQEGEYVVSVRYNSTTKADKIYLFANGTRRYVNCEKTARNEWRWTSFNVTMKAGTNTFTITNSYSLPLYIDQISYRPADVDPMQYDVVVNQAEGGNIIADRATAAEGDTITLTVTPEEGFRLKELRVVNSVFYTMGKTIEVSNVVGPQTVTFVMPNDNMVLQPKYEDATEVYNLDLQSVIAGAMPAGWRCVQESSEVHEYPNTFSAGARVFAGFTGHQGKALYWRNDRAEYGRQDAFPLTLQAGSYKLTYSMAAWKDTPTYNVQILNAVSGSVIKTSATFTATPNANGSTSASVSSATNRTLEFDIEQEGNYIICFNDKTTTGGYHEFLLLECRLNITSLANGIADITYGDSQQQPATIFDATGRQRQGTVRGMYIIRHADGSTRKVINNR